MAGYPKIWTTIRHESWFKRLRSVQRSIWLQLILIAKEQFDDGNVTFNSYSHMAQELGVDRASIMRWVKRETGTDCAGVVPNTVQELGGRCTKSRACVVEKSTTVVHLFLTNYNDSQEVKSYKPKKTGFDIKAEHKAEHKAKRISSKPKGLDQTVHDKEFQENIIKVYEFYIKHSGRNPNLYKLTKLRKQKIAARLKEGFNLEQMGNAIYSVLDNKFLMGDNDNGKQYIELEKHIFNSYEQTEKRIREYKEK